MNDTPAKEVVVYNFFDYREYLRAVYNFRKKELPGFSHRSFSREAGISSPNYLLRVLKGTRSLSGAYIAGFCKALGLKRGEARYFAMLVRFNNETAADKKEKVLRSLLALRCRRGILKLDDRKLKFFSKWYYPLIRELAVIMDFKDDFNLLARSCFPRITAQQAASSLSYLLRAGFLKKDVGGRYTRTEPLISSGDEVQSTILRNYHRRTLGQSMEALNTVNLENRDISSLTLSVSRKTYFAIKKEIQVFRKRLLVMAKEDTGPEMVCLAGFQLIPRSKMKLAKDAAR
jgi:uncharacterized protein (TIGR02147 family)